jgi:hypothetical protein
MINYISKKRDPAPLTKPPIEQNDIVMKEEKMFFKTIELAANEIKKDEFEHYRIQQEVKRKQVTFIVIVAAIGFALFLLFLI